MASTRPLDEFEEKFYSSSKIFQFLYEFIFCLYRLSRLNPNYNYFEKSEVSNYKSTLDSKKLNKKNKVINLIKYYHLK